MKIEINLYRDMINLVMKKIDRLKCEGFKFPELEEWKKSHATGNARDDLCRFHTEQVHLYLSLEHRLIAPIPRRIRYAKGFCVPDNLVAGITMVETEIKRGDNLLPRQSRQIFSPTKQDGLLLDWGIQHLHLGTSPDQKNPCLIQGGNEILFAVFEDETAYFLTIGDHKQWADKDLLRIIHESYPEILSRYELPGIIPGNNQELTNEQRIDLRKSGGNNLFEIDEKVYMPPGGGFTTAGTGLAIMAWRQHIIAWYEAAEDTINEQAPSMVREFGIDTQRLSLKMTALDNDAIRVIDRCLGVKVVLWYTDDRRDFAGMTAQLESSI